ncbi:DUF805 domain-containing protein [Enterovibrio sp. ZSDZ35]|uniref:DUF805 domain-containing protein n=1 Tax=Enterovibrio qingdaonensis TaxID=2899818 RepID=A0ABT5QQC9_9GAMM|nr:DUF805 domain-containing protein [Enterovibrio sp. ZSDZ35]MDD1782700.1 DUF805 domain-containing protein [Enterovibrio sp. ZSDZ35]
MNQLKMLFSLRGRIRRRDWWLYQIPLLILCIPAAYELINGVSYGIISPIGQYAAFFGSLALSIKRIQDRDLSLYWALILVVPIIGMIFSLVELGLKDGTPGPNRYGPDPKGRGGKDQDGNGSSQIKKEKDTAVFEG